MGQLIEMSDTLTMGTREIAEMLGKNHSDIKRSAERLSEQGIFTQPLAESDFTNGRGRVYPEYHLNKRDSIILVAQNCPEFTARIVDRWQELEEGVASRPTALSHVDQIKGLLAAGLLTVTEAENAVLRSVGMRKLPSARTKAASKKPRAHAVAHGLTFEQAIQEFVANMSGTGTIPTEDAYLLFCEMYGTNMARRIKFVSAVKGMDVEKRPIRFSGISKQGFIFH
jgi:phage regulator Rha-like protein